MTLFLAFVTPAVAQVGRVEGVVRDPSGAVVPKAQIEVKNTNTGVTRSTVSDASGRYAVLSLQVGEYEVKGSAQGFRPTVQTGVTLVIDRTAIVDFNLIVGQVTETLSVTADVPLIESSHAALGEVVQTKQILELPLNGRSYTQLALLAPGVVAGGVGIGTRTQENAVGQSGFFSISGSRPEGNQFTYNGMNVTNEFTGGTFAYPPIDSIQEFKIVQNSYGAELGGRTGQVLVTTKGGTNEFRGSAYEFLRNDKLDANNFFGNLAGLKRRPLKQNQFGASVGGPVVLPGYSGRNRTFFFVNYEGARIRRGNTLTTTVPTARMREGDFAELGRAIRDPLTGNPSFPNAIIPANRISPIARNAIRLADYPLQNIAGVRNNYTIAPSARNDLNQLATRVDQSFSEKDKIWGTFYWAKLDIASPRFTQITDALQDVTTQAYSANWTHIFQPALLNDFKAGFNFASQDVKNRSPQNITTADLGFPNNQNQPQARGISAGIPSFAPLGYGSLGAAAGPPQLFKTRHFQIGDTLSWIKNSHTLRFGVDITREHEDQRFNPQIRGNYSFGGAYTGDGFADFLLGVPGTAIREILLPASNLFESLHRGTHYYFFAQDDFKVKPNLTINLGLRYEYNSPVVEARDRQANFYPSGGKIVRIDAPDSQYGRCLCNPDKNNWGPRLGIVWRPFNSQKTVVRTGAGLFYNYVPYNTKQTLAFNTPQIDRQIVTNTVPTPTFDLANSFIPGSLASAFAGFSNDLNFFDATVRQWNFNIQREVVESLMVEISYAGSLATHLDINTALNAANPGPGPLPPRRPLPNELAVISASNSATATYHAFTVKARKEFSGGLTFLTHYTKSKAIDNSSSQLADYQNANDVRSNKALAGFHVSDRFVASAVYEMPFGRGRRYMSSIHPVGDAVLGGWMLTGMFSAQSGFFMSPTAPNTIGIEAGTVRANRIGKGNLPVAERNRLRWFDTAAFVAPVGFQYGTAGRNILEGPGLKNLDLGILKDFRITESHKLQFRAEFFNAFNNVNFGLPSANIAAAPYGTIASAGASREVQFALKYIF